MSCSTPPVLKLPKTVISKVDMSYFLWSGSPRMSPSCHISMTSPVPFSSSQYMSSQMFSSPPPPPQLTLANLSKFDSKFEPKFEPNLTTQLRPSDSSSVV